MNSPDKGHTHEKWEHPGNYGGRNRLPLRRDFGTRGFTVGIGGPVGSGKTALMLALCRELRDRMSVCAVTNDIFTKEDAEFLMRNEALPRERIRAVETGGCPHAAIREDISANLLALEHLANKFHPDLLLLESGGDNLAAHFSRELADYTIYVIDVAGGDKIPRKGGPGITQSDLLVINKTDLAVAVGADLNVMERDSRVMRGDGPFLFTQVRAAVGVDQIIEHVLAAPALRALRVERYERECRLNGQPSNCISHPSYKFFYSARRMFLRAGRKTRASRADMAPPLYCVRWKWAPNQPGQFCCGKGSMKRKLLTCFCAPLLALASAASVRGEDTVKIGVLHSLSGTMAISETSLRDAVLMAVDEINAKGGVMGKKIEPVVVDPASDWPKFAEKAKELIVQDKVAVTFGCWTSVSRKSALPVFEATYTADQNPYGGGLLFYPVQYEGEEQSPHIFYTGASPNEQLIPAAEYMMSKDGGSKKKFYLLGTDYVFPRTANKVLKAFLLSKGVPESSIAEEYTPFGHSDYQTIVSKIKDFSKDGDACVLSTINGDSNVPFYKEFANQGLTADKCAIMAFSVAEDELRSMETEKLVGHLAAWNYFESIDTPENKAFVAAFKKYCKDKGLPGGDARVTDDPIEAAYFGVYVWKAAVEKAGSFDIAKVIPDVLGEEFDAPGGHKHMDAINHHTWKPVYIGSIRADGQFDIIWHTPAPVHPDSFSPFLHPPEELKKLTGG